MDHGQTALMDDVSENKPSGPARVGGELRAVRERLGWRLSDVAAELRIRLPYLEAIERGELSALPGAAYQTGFVRTYSQALGLDGDEILRRFRAEGTGFVPKAELSFLAPVPDRGVPTGAIVLLGVVLVLVGYGFWYRHTEQVAQLAAAIPSVPTELAPLAVPPKPPSPVVQATAKPVAAPAATAAQAISAGPGTAGPVPTGKAPAGQAPAGQVPAGQATASAATAAPAASASAVAAAAPAAPVTPAATAIPATAPAIAPPPGPAPAPPGDQSQPSSLTIVATGDSWVQVKDPKGNILFSKTLHAGDSWPVPVLPGLILTAGNAGNTAIAENGKSGSPLGSTGTVLRNYALTPPAPGASPSPAAPTSTN
jgi:cytoskeleton protein RodZ